MATNLFGRLLGKVWAPLGLHYYLWRDAREHLPYASRTSALREKEGGGKGGGGDAFFSDAPIGVAKKTLPLDGETTTKSRPTASFCRLLHRPRALADNTEDLCLEPDEVEIGICFSSRPRATFF